MHSLDVVLRNRNVSSSLRAKSYFWNFVHFSLKNIEFYRKYEIQVNLMLNEFDEFNISIVVQINELLSSNEINKKSMYDVSRVNYST